MSQQIKALELSLGFPLFERRNRSFILTLAGEYFYQKSLGLVQTYEKLCKEAQKIAAGNQASLKIGILRTLSHEPLLQTLETFFQIYPQVSIEILSGNHEELFDWIRNEKVDLVLSDQRRAFSSKYVNLILITATLQLEMSKHHPLALRSFVEISTLKEFPCLVISSFSQRQEEQDYFQAVIGFSGEFRFVSSLEEAKLCLVSTQSVWPRFSFEPLSPFICRIPLKRKGQPIVQTLCLFWKKDNSGYYIEELAEKLQASYHEDLFHIEQKHPYSSNYILCTQQAQHDLKTQARPELVNLPKNLESYDEIYLGYPNYWGDAPMAVYSFLDAFPLDGKTIHPFCTHEGSGLGRTVSNLSKAYPQVHFEKGLAIYGSEVDQSQSLIDNWIKR